MRTIKQMSAAARWDNPIPQTCERASGSHQRVVGCVENLKCKNGDTLTELKRRKADAEAVLKRYRNEVEELEEKIRPLRELVDEAEAQMSNVRTRIRIWMDEHGEKMQAANDPDQRPGAKG